MTIKSRINKLEKIKKTGDKSFIVARDDSSDPNYVTVKMGDEEKRMTQAEFTDLQTRLGEDVTIIHLVYDKSKPTQDDPN